MSELEIKNNAPKGATHYDSCDMHDEVDYYAKDHDYSWQTWCDDTKSWELCTWDVIESLLKPL